MWQFSYVFCTVICALTHRYLHIFHYAFLLKRKFQLTKYICYPINIVTHGVIYRLDINNFDKIQFGFYSYGRIKNDWLTSRIRIFLFLLSVVGFKLRIMVIVMPISIVPLDVCAVYRSKLASTTYAVCRNVVGFQYRLN